jgi:hypothetical protein
MKILVKLLSPEVKTLSGWIVYVMDDNDNALQADVCDLDSLVNVITKFKTKYKL